MQTLTPQMRKITKNLGSVMKSMDTVKIGTTMDKFENIMNDLDVVTGATEASFNSVSATSTPAGEVRTLFYFTTGFPFHNIPLTYVSILLLLC